MEFSRVAVKTSGTGRTALTLRHEELPLLRIFDLAILIVIGVMIYAFNPTNSGGYVVPSWDYSPTAAVRYVPPTPRPTPYFFPQTVSPMPTVRPEPSRGATPTPPNPTATPYTSDAATWVCQPKYGWPCTTALGVAWCESRHVTTAYNTAGYYGLFQMDYYLHIGLFHGGDPFDPYVNTQAAYELWLEQGWAPWPNC